METKRCPRCGYDKTFDKYQKSSRSKNKIQTYCRDCSNAMNEDRRVKRKHSSATIFRNSKVCVQCKVQKPISQFGKREDSADKHMTYCKPCWVTYTQRAQKRALDKKKKI